MEIETREFNLERTLTCGQTFCWNRTEGELYGKGSDEFYTFRNGEPLLVSQSGSTLEAQTRLEEKDLREALGLQKDLEALFDGFPDDERLAEARRELNGLRIVQDEFFPCLVSYLLSPQMQIPVIKRRFDEIAERYGESVEFSGRELRRFPDRSELSKVSESELRDIGVGYRAEYVVRSLEILEDLEEREIARMNYEDARDKLKQLYGVGNKVADCVLLFSLGFHEACPLDTWAWRAVETHFPELNSETYEETSENLRRHFGDHAGYALEYFFHGARKGVIEVEE